MDPSIINAASFSAPNPTSYSLAEIWPCSAVAGSTGGGDNPVGGGMGLRMCSFPGFAEAAAAANSVDESTVTEQSGSRGNVGRKRRDVNSAGDEFTKVASTSAGANPNLNDSIGKRMKSSSKSKDETCGLMVETESTSRAITKQNEQTNKSEPPKEYIHVRARRGQATDSHSLAERARREKISERMKILQDLVPGCNKVIGKALVLDEIINYIQSLQCQVEFLSMKLEAVNCKMNPTLEAFSQKDLEPATTFHPSGMLLDTQPAPRDYTRETHQEWLHMHQIGSSFEKGL